MTVELLPMDAPAWAARIRPLLGQAVEAIVATGREFIAAKHALPLGEFGRLADELGLSADTVQRFMAIARNDAISDTAHARYLPPSWYTLYELSRLEPPRLIYAIEQGAVTPELDRAGARQVVKDYAVLDVGERPAKANQPTVTFNQVNDNIGWARWSWNPVTGCLHNCDYCYARDIAERFYPQKFEPTFLPERLEAPGATTLPANANGDPAWRRVFTCSMADLFGKWVPKEWITAVFNAIDQHRQWEYLCLTKFPQRLAQLEWPENVWAGTTVDKQHRVAVAERAFSKVTAGVKWLSCEPLLEPLQFKSLAMFDWVVIGASTGSAHAQPFAPPFEWVVDLYQQARDAGCRVYLKHNLFGSSDGRSPGMEPVREWPR